MRYHNAKLTAQLIIKGYDEDEKRLTDLAFSNKLTKQEYLELLRIQKSKALIKRLITVLN